MKTKSITREEYALQFAERFRTPSRRAVRDIRYIGGKLYDFEHDSNWEFSHGELRLDLLVRHGDIADAVLSHLRRQYPSGYVRAEVERCVGKSEQEVGTYTGLVFVAA